MAATNERTHTPLQSIVLHLAPGAAITLFVAVLAGALPRAGIPTMFWLETGFLAVGAPVMLAVMKRGARREGSGGTWNVITYRARLRWWEYLLWPALMLVIAGGVMTTLGRIVTPIVKSALFSWLPATWDAADYLLNPAAYSRAWRIVTWALGLLTTTIWFPAMEELYFRGFLLPRIRGTATVAVIAGAVLFACYHLFSPWQIPVRIVALLPFIWFVRWKKDVRLGIIAHVALNLVGDTISSIPIVFG
jgi:uncharacterized protein